MEKLTGFNKAGSQESAPADDQKKTAEKQASGGSNPCNHQELPAPFLLVLPARTIVFDKP